MFKKLVLCSFLFLTCLSSIFAEVPAPPEESAVHLSKTSPTLGEGPDLLIIIFYTNGVINDIVISDDTRACITVYVFEGTNIFPSGGFTDCP